jgi:hypothetical protein
MRATKPDHRGGSLAKQAEAPAVSAAGQLAEAPAVSAAGQLAEAPAVAIAGQLAEAHAQEPWFFGLFGCILGAG